MNYSAFKWFWLQFSIIRGIFHACYSLFKAKLIFLSLMLSLGGIWPSAMCRNHMYIQWSKPGRKEQGANTGVWTLLVLPIIQLVIYSHQEGASYTSVITRKEPTALYQCEWEQHSIQNLPEILCLGSQSSNMLNHASLWSQAKQANSLGSVSFADFLLWLTCDLICLTHRKLAAQGKQLITDLSSGSGK